MIYLSLFFRFFKIGAFTFGGGYAMLPLIQETVLEQGWLTREQLVDFIAVSESTPGPFAVNISTYIGARTAGLAGAVCATLGVILPSFLVILLVARCYARFRKNRAVNGCMEGLRPAVIGLIGAAVLSVGSSTFDFSVPVSRKNLLLLGILAVAGLLSRKKVHPILIICISGGLGIFSGLLLQTM